MKRTREQTARFVARGSDGQTYRVIEVTEFMHTTSLSDAPQKLEGLKSYHLADGRSVNRISDTEFEIVGGVRLTKIE